MKQRTAFVATVALSFVTTVHCANAQGEPGFKMPSKNVYCIIEDAVDLQPTDLRCDIQQMNNPMPTPPSSCPLSWGDAFSITQIGPPAGWCATATRPKTTICPSWLMDPSGTKGFSCKSETSGLTCVNSRGHGFSLSRAHNERFSLRDTILRVQHFQSSHSTSGGRASNATQPVLVDVCQRSFGHSNSKAPKIMLTFLLSSLSGVRIA